MIENLKNSLSKNFTILKLYLKRSESSNQSSSKFIIISRSRTGSTMIINYLKKSPGSFIQREIMGRKKSTILWKKIPELFFNKNLSYNLVGFKYFYYHPVDDYDSNNHVFQFLAKHREVKIIHWLREDLFAVILSRYIAERTKTYEHTKKSRPLSTFKVDETEFSYELEKTIAQIKSVRSLFSTFENYAEFTYEDITQRGKLQEVFDFLKVDSQGIEHETKTSQRSREKYKFVKNLKSLKEIYLERMEHEKKSLFNLENE